MVAESPRSDRWTQRLRTYFSSSGYLDLCACVLCLVVCLIGRSATHDLRWPCEADLYRDLGAAQSMRDGSFGQDPGYLAERSWYPPLVPAIVGFTSRLVGLRLHEGYTILGAYLNLIGPIGLYAMMARLFDRRIALASLVGFLFYGQLDLMSWLHATYSPWLWPCNFAQGLFYLGVLAVVVTFDGERRVRGALVTGSAIGLTTLAHVAPGLLLGGIATTVAVSQALTTRRQTGALTRNLGTLLLIAVVAAVVASPFWWHLVATYQLEVRNDDPLRWVAGELTVQQLGPILQRFLSVRGCVAVLGIVGLFVVPRRSGTSSAALFTWGAMAFLGLAYGFVSQVVRLPPLLPSWHFYFYLQGYEAAVFGVGVGTLGYIFERVRGALGWMKGRPIGTRVAEVCIAGLLLTVVLFRWERYSSRPDLASNRRDSLHYAKQPALEIYKWALRRAEPSDVILANVDTSFFIAAAGRKVVALPALFSNPYVPLGPRHADAGVMQEELLGGRLTQFPRLARAYNVKYVAVPASARSALGRLPFLKRVFAARSGTDLYRLDINVLEQGALGPAR